MQSEFYTVALDRLRYSLVWEDCYPLYHGLDLQPDDRVLVITSAGCNVLNALLKSPRQVIAIDLNPVQNKLLLLKKHLILRHEHAVFRALMGFDGPTSVAPAVQQLSTTLPEDVRGYWLSFFGSHPEGILTAGKLEAYTTGFFDTLGADVQQKLRQLIQFETVDAQRNFFMSELHTGPFRDQFIQYFDDENLSKGRDATLFKHAREPGGVAFYNRLLRQVSTTTVRNNFFFRFFFFGPQYLPEAILPPCYQQQNYRLLNERLNRLTIVDGEAVDYLLSDKGALVNKASLSNIFEYTNQDEFRRVCRLLHSRTDRHLRFVFWNLLQQQGAFLDADGWNDVPVSSDPVSRDAACFFFRNFLVAEAEPVTQNVPKSS